MKGLSVTPPAYTGGCGFTGCVLHGADDVSAPPKILSEVDTFPDPTTPVFTEGCETPNAATSMDIGPPHSGGEIASVYAAPESPAMWRRLKARKHSLEARRKDREGWTAEYLAGRHKGPALRDTAWIEPAISEPPAIDPDDPANDLEPEEETA